MMAVAAVASTLVARMVRVVVAVAAVVKETAAVGRVTQMKMTATAAGLGRRGKLNIQRTRI